MPLRKIKEEPKSWTTKKKPTDISDIGKKLRNALAGGIKGKPHSSPEGQAASAGRTIKRLGQKNKRHWREDSPREIKVAKSAQHPHSKLKTQKELKKITDSSSYKKADYKGKTEMLGGKVYKSGGAVTRFGSTGPEGKPHSTKEGRSAEAQRAYMRQHGPQEPRRKRIWPKRAEKARGGPAKSPSIGRPPKQTIRDRLKEASKRRRKSFAEYAGGSEKAKPHSTKEGRHAAGRRKFKRIIEKLTPKARPRPLPSPGRPARPVRPLPSPGGPSHTRPARPLLPRDMKREKKAVGSVVKGAGKIGKKFLDFIKTGKLVDKHGVKVNVPKAAERLTGKPHVDHGKRKRIKHLGKGKATGGRIGLQHGSRPRPQGPHVPHPHRPRGVKIAKRW